ncbi:MAG: hypothetical protein RLZ68_2451, partial [Pseudomonadota bacterium]
MVKSNASGYQLRLPKIAGGLFLAIALALTGSTVAAKAKKSKSEVMITEETETSASTTREYRQVTLSLKQLGAWSSLQLRGVDGTQSLVFPIRSDEVVVS